MLRIKKIVATDGLGGFWNDDNEAIKRGAKQDGFAYIGKPVTPGFKSIRQPSRAVPVILVLENGEWAFGDCTWVQYGGERAGREKLVSTEEVVSNIHQKLDPWLIGREIEDFRSIMSQMEEELELSRAIRYGVSQALLDAVAKNQERAFPGVF